MTMFEKIPVHTMSDSVAEKLLAQIDKGVFAKGIKLPTEAALAQAFGVSRTVIREVDPRSPPPALRILRSGPRRPRRAAVRG